MSNYTRVIPRDLFNEAKLLKCLGALSLYADDSEGGALSVQFYGDGFEGFEVCQNPADGSISVYNVRIWIGGREVRAFTPLNSRAPWPLWLEYLDAQRSDEPFPAFLNSKVAPVGRPVCLSNELKAVVDHHNASLRHG